MTHLPPARAPPARQELHKGTPLVLCIDECPASQKALRQMLEPFGYVVEAAFSGEEALEHLAVGASVPDVVLLDLVRPRTRALEAMPPPQALLGGFTAGANQRRQPSLFWPPAPHSSDTPPA